MRGFPDSSLHDINGDCTAKSTTTLQQMKLSAKHAEDYFAG